MRASGEENAFLALVETTELRSHESSDRLEAVILVLTAQVVVNAIHSGAGGFVVFENICNGGGNSHTGSAAVLDPSVP